MSDLPAKEKDELTESLENSLQEAVDAADEQQVMEIVESISSQEALRQASLMKADDREQMMSIMTPVIPRL